MSKNGNSEGSIRKRANGGWEARYTDGRTSDGKQKQRSIYGKTRKEVAEKLNTIIQQQQLGTYVTPNKVCLKDWLIQWLATYAIAAVRPSAYISYEGYVHNHIIPSIGHIPIQQVTLAVIQNFYNQKFNSGRVDGNGGLSAKTIRNMHNMSHNALDLACMNNLIFKNPTVGAVIPKQDKEEIRVLSPDKESRLIAVSYNHRLGCAIRFDLATGLRVGELYALKWSDIDFKRHTVKISRTLQRVKKNMNQQAQGQGNTTILKGSVKTNNGYREIPLIDPVFNMLMAHLEQQNAEKQLYGMAYCNNDYIFATSLGTCVEPSLMRDVLNNLLEQTEIKHIKFHALRHTFATRAIERGMDVKTLSTILGHATVQLTMDIYCHSSIDQMRLSMEKFSRMF